MVSVKCQSCCGGVSGDRLGHDRSGGDEDGVSGDACVGDDLGW